MSAESDISRWLAPIERLAERAPLYVAYPLATFLLDYAQTPRAPRLALFSLCESVEAVVRFIAIARSVEIIERSKTGKAPEWLAKTAADNLLRPTFGKWMNLLRMVAEHGGAHRSVLVPDLADASVRLDSELFARPPSDGHAELYDLFNVRNAIAHGSGISDGYAATLLDHWLPKIAIVLAGLDFLTEIELWMRDPDGCKRLNGPHADRPPEQPPKAVGEKLPLGGVALVRGDHIVMQHPLGRRAPHRDPDRHLAQIFVRESDGGLVYSLFGAEDALQAESSLDELERLERMFDIAAIRAAQRSANFQQRDYDNEFASDAAAFIGREDALETLWQSVVSRPQGIVFVSGPAGIGKSSLVARVAEDLRAEIAERAKRKQSTEFLLAYRFIDRDRGCAPLPFLLWLIERLAAAKGAAVKAGSDQTIEALRDTGLRLFADPGFDRIILVLDGLDEMARREKRFIADLIDRLGKIDRLLVVASSRPQTAIDDAMKAAEAVVLWPGGLPEMSPAELRAMLVALLPRAARKLVQDDRADGNAVRNDFIAALVARAKGLPLYVRMAVQATHAKDFTLDRLKNPDWLPERLVEFFDRLVDRGTLRTDVDHLAPIVGCLLALAKEPLSADEIGALLSRDLTPRRAELIRRRYGFDPVENRRKIAEQVLRDLAGLLRASIGTDLQRRFRLLHDDLQTYVLHAPTLGDAMAGAEELLAIQAMKPGDDAASFYLFRNGIEHIIEGGVPGRRHGAEEAARLLAGFDYQLQRLAVATTMGGDGGIREDWTRIQDVIAEEGGSLDDVPRAWRHFWATDGSLFEAGEGRDAARELLERVLEYAPDTVVGSSYSYPARQ
jgi:hypothetical protein